MSIAVQKQEELAWLLSKVAALNPKVIVEIGVDQGGTFQAFETLGAEVIGIDIGAGSWSSGPPLEDPRVIRGDSHHPETRIELKRRLAGRRIDFLLIDGDHSFDGVAHDYWSYARLARMVALHDIAEHKPESGVQVAAFWRRIKHLHPTAEEFITEPENWGGYALFTTEED